MKFFYCDHHTFPLPIGHRFPLPKYALLRQRIQTEIPHAELIESPAATPTQILRVHDEAYWQKLITHTLTDKEQRRLGLPWSDELLTRSLHSVGGTFAAAEAAFTHRLTMNLAGGTHHAYPDHGEGFCVFNDIAIVIRELQAQNKIQRAMIIDCDVHQGNGTAFVFKDDPHVFTFSMHGAKNFPLHKEKSSLDIELPDGTNDDDYLNELEWGLQRASDSAHAQIAFYLAGSDPYAGDSLGRLKLTKEGIKKRDQLVIEKCLSLEIPTIITMSGGYAREINDSVEIHFNTAQVAAELITPLP